MRYLVWESWDRLVLSHVSQHFRQFSLRRASQKNQWIQNPRDKIHRTNDVFKIVLKRSLLKPTGNLENGHTRISSSDGIVCCHSYWVVCRSIQSGDKQRWKAAVADCGNSRWRNSQVVVCCSSDVRPRDNKRFKSDVGNHYVCRCCGRCAKTSQRLE